MYVRYSKERNEVFQYFLPNGLTNTSIDHDKLLELPISWRMYWAKIDFSQLNLTDKDKLENTTKAIEEIEDKITEEELLLDDKSRDYRELNLKAKSHALGEWKVQGLDEETKPEKEQTMEDIDRLSKTPFNVTLMTTKKKLDSKRKELLGIRKNNAMITPLDRSSSREVDRSSA